MYKKVLSIVLVVVLFSTIIHGSANAMSLGDFFNTIVRQFSFSPTSLLGQVSGDPAFLPAAGDQVIQEQSGDILVSFEGVFYDKSNEKWTRDWSGETRQDRSTIVDVNGTNYLVQVMSKTGAYGYPSNPTSHDYLAVFSLNDPYHPALVGEIDMTAYSKSHSSGLDPLSPCDIGDMEVVEYDGALRGFVAGGCRTSNNRLATAYKAWFTLSQDGGSNALQISKYDVTTTNDDNILDADPTSFIGGALFKGSDGRLYSFGVKPRLRDYLLVIHDVTSASHHTVVYESEDLYRNNLIATGSHGDIVPEVPVGVIYSGNTPYIVMTDLEFPGYINNVWTSIIDVSNVFAPRFVFQGADNTWFTNATSPQAAGCVEGCDRTAFERTVLEYHYSYFDGMWRSNGPEQYGVSSAFLDEENNRIYRPAWDKWICTDHDFECFGTNVFDQYSGEVRFRYQVGVLDMTNPSSPARVSQPIIGSQKWDSRTNTIVRAPGPFYTNINSIPRNSDSNILLNMPFAAKYNFLIMSIYESGGVTSQRGNRIGYLKNGTYYWDAGSQQAFEQMYASMNTVPDALVFNGLAGDQRRLTSGNILRINNGEYAAYVSLAGGAVGAFSITTDGSGGGSSTGGDDTPVGLGDPVLSSGVSIFSPSNLLRFFRRVLGL